MLSKWLYFVNSWYFMRTEIVVNVPYTLQFDFNDYDVVFAPHNSGNHWELFVVYPGERKIIYLNPMGEVQSVRKQYVSAIAKFLSSKIRDTDVKNKVQWTDYAIVHPKQQDSHSCGVHVVEVCFQSDLALLSGKDVYQRLEGV